MPNPDLLPELVDKMKKLQALSDSIMRLKESLRGREDAIQLQNLEEQRRILWNTLPPLKQVV